jgi:hypothetical protein
MGEPFPTIDDVRRRTAARQLGLPLAATWDQIRADPRYAIGVELGLITAVAPPARGLPPAEHGHVIEHIERPPREKAVQRAVYALYVAHGCRVFWLSQARATGQTAGLPDLYVFHEGVGASWWHEVKPPTGALSDAQRDFQRLCTATLTRHVTGGEEAARRMLAALGITLTP